MTIKNTSDIDGKEVVQVYTSDSHASISPDNKRLRAFRKIFIPLGDSKECNFRIPVSDLSFVNLENKYVVESGEFTIHVGGNSKDLTSLKFFVR